MRINSQGAILKQSLRVCLDHKLHCIGSHLCTFTRRQVVDCRISQHHNGAILRVRQITKEFVATSALGHKSFPNKLALLTFLFQIHHASSSLSVALLSSATLFSDFLVSLLDNDCNDSKSIIISFHSIKLLLNHICRREETEISILSDFVLALSFNYLAHQRLSAYMND